MANRLKIKFYRTKKEKKDAKAVWLIVLGVLVIVAIVVFLLQVYKGLITK